MPPVTGDVAAAGAANAASYAARAAAILSLNPHLAELAAMLADAMPSTNIDGGKVIDFDSADAVLDARSLWIQREGGNVAAGIAKFEKEQGGWGPRRVGFEDLWDRGHDFIYGAVNPDINHAGVGGRYGAFCIVIRPARVSGADSAVFPGNSAKLYGRDNGIADAAAAYADAGGWASVPDMGVAVFGTEAASMPPPDWPLLVCSETQYLEVVTAGPIDFSDILEVRIGAAQHEDLNKWSRLDRRKRLPEKYKQNAVAGWRTVKAWTKHTHPHIALRIV